MPGELSAEGTTEEQKILTREQLYAEVWAEPLTKVAARHRTYLNILAKVCQRLNVPRPPQGYWARRAAGKTTARPPLPEALPGDEQTWARGGYAPVAVPLPEPVRAGRRPKVRLTVHPLIEDARKALEGAEKTEVGYLKPSRYSLVDAFVSAPVASRALDILNALFLLLERRGHRVVLAPRDVQFGYYSTDHRERKAGELRPSERWAPGRHTLVYVRGVAFGLRLFEIAEPVEVKYVDGKYIPVKDLPEPKRRRWQPTYDWTTTQDRPSGRLALHAYSPYQQANWSRQWVEKSSGTLSRSCRDVVRTLEGSTGALRELVAEGQRRAEEEQRRWEEQRRQWAREAEEKRRAEALRESRDQLVSIVEGWAWARNLESFFRDIEERASGLSLEEQQAMGRKLAKAREMVGGTDSLQRFGKWLAPNER